MYTCQVCHNEINNIPYIGEERMFGMGDQFQYFKCSNCGCLQIASIPENLDKYYPENYYSYSYDSTPHSLKARIVDGLLKHALAVRLGHWDVIGSLAQIYNPYYKKAYAYLNRFTCDFDSKILDVGCGNGFHLQQLRNWGFLNLTGADPFIKSDIHYKNGISVYKKYISELEGSYDFIMLHHSFEHMPDPLDVFVHLERLLAQDGTIVIRIPVVDGYAWRKYGMHWYQVDAPRHFFLHTKKSISLLSKSVNLKVVKVEFDSNEAQIINSEKYLEGIALNTPYKPSCSLVKAARKKVKELNSLMDGDQACFYIKR